MKVHLLCTCRKKEFLPGMLMVFDSIRVGFPNAEIHAWWNRRNSSGVPESLEILRMRSELLQIQVRDFNTGDFAHPWWIEMLFRSETGQYAIIDTDMVFHDNCEHLPFDSSVHLAGVWVPRFYCPVARAITMPRIHTCFVYVPSGEHLQQAIEAITWKDIAVTPLQMVHPFVYMHEGKRYFQDVLGGASQVLGCGHFGADELRRFDHLHNGTIIDLVEERHPNGKQMKERVQAAYHNPACIRNSWPLYEAYYQERSK